MPTYNPSTVYGAPVEQPPGYSGTSMLMAGVVGFGAGMLLSSLINSGNNSWGTNWYGRNVVYNRNVYVSNSNYFARRYPGYRPGYGYPNRPGYPGYPNRPGYPGYPNRPGYPAYPIGRAIPPIRPIGLAIPTTRLTGLDIPTTRPIGLIFPATRPTGLDIPATRPTGLDIRVSVLTMFLATIPTGNPGLTPTGPVRATGPTPAGDPVEILQAAPTGRADRAATTQRPGRPTT